MQDWWAISWFNYNQLSNLSWARPWVLYFLPLVPVIVLLKFFAVKSAIKGLPIALMASEAVKSHWTVALRWMAPITQILTIGMLFLALARPMVQINTQQKISEGIDIVFALDVSESMANTDMQPNRLFAAKSIINNFINNRLQDRIGLVIFAGEAFTLAPLTTDYAALAQFLETTTTTTINAQGTAIGNAIAVAANKLKMANSKTKIVILLSDGDNTAGSIDPVTAAKIAALYQVKIYSILVGKQSKNEQSAEENSIDANQLKSIAAITGGQYFYAPGQNEMIRIFEKINKLEKVKYSESSSNILADVYHVYLRWAALFFLVWFATKITFLGNIIID
jgi:Ca-activated chloride channel homolog